MEPGTGGLAKKNMRLPTLIDSEGKTEIGARLIKRSYLFQPMSQKNPLIMLLGLLILTPRAFAAFGFNLDGTLDKPTISRAYFEGDFGRILPPLEAWRQGIADNKTRDDSIFVFKYLSVIYAANPSTKEKSRSFMFQLLTLAPTIEILDMYASDEIERTFHTVKQEFKKRNAYLSTHDHLGNEKPRPVTTTPATVQPKESHSSKWIWWTVGGVGLAAVAAGGYYTFHQDHATPKEKIAEP
jgi:hypothetical protein